MEWLGIIAAVIIGLFGFFIGHKTSDKNKGTPGAEEIIDEQSEAVEEAGADLADAMAASPDTRVKRVLGWLRSRSGDGGE